MTESLGFRVHYTRDDAPLSDGYCRTPLRPSPLARHSEGATRPKNPPNGSAMAAMTYSQNLLSFSRSAALVSDANPAKRIASEKEEQGSERSFRRKAEAEPSGLCDDAIPRYVAEE